MTGQIVAICAWRALDREGEDKCRLAHVDHGWLLVGHARFRDDAGFAALDYMVRCDGRWQTLSADIAGTHGPLEVNIKIVHGSDGWRLNGVAQPGLVTARDIDLSFTPATNLMPLRRLAEGGGPQLRLRAAWLRYPEARLLPLDQIYRGDGAGHVDYAAEQTDYATRLQVDKSGFITRYPGNWEGEVTHAG